jgi:hypothetical protein
MENNYLNICVISYKFVPCCSFGNLCAEEHSAYKWEIIKSDPRHNMYKMLLGTAGKANENITRKKREK